MVIPMQMGIQKKKNIELDSGAYFAEARLLAATVLRPP